MKKKTRNSDEKIFLIRECPECAYVMEPHQRKCPECGCHGNIKERVVEVVDGKLIELQKKAAEKEIQLKKQAENKGAKTLDEFIDIAKQRGYEIGWALVRFKSKVLMSHQYQNPATITDKLNFCVKYFLNFSTYNNSGLEAAIMECWNKAKK